MKQGADLSTQMQNLCNLIALPRYEAVLSQSCALLAECLGAAFGVLFLLDDAGQNLVAVGGHRIGHTQWAPPDLRIPMAGIGLANCPMTQITLTGRAFCTSSGGGYDLAPLEPIFGSKITGRTCFLPLILPKGNLGGVFIIARATTAPELLSAPDMQRTLRAISSLIDLRRSERQKSQQKEMFATLVSRADRERDAWRQGNADRLREMLPGSSAFMRGLREKLQGLANFRHPILISGPAGLDKEGFARALHKISKHAASPFVYVSCWTLNADTFAPELFGHKRGAIRGVASARRGLLREAGEGMVFFDQVDALGPAEQALLLRLLETGQYRPLGSERDAEVSQRLVFSANRPLADLVEAGAFLPQLYHRMAQSRIAITALAERREDIADLARDALQRAAKDQRRNLQFAPEALTWLMGLDLPGNTRELNAMVQCATHRVGPDGVIEPGHFTDDETRKGPAPDQLGLRESVELFEAALIRKTLESHGNSRALTAEILGIPKRTLADKCLKYGL